MIGVIAAAIFSRPFAKKAMQRRRELVAAQRQQRAAAKEHIRAVHSAASAARHSAPTPGDRFSRADHELARLAGERAMAKQAGRKVPRL